MLFCCVKFSIRQLFCCVKFEYHLSSRKWQAQLYLIQWVLCELMLLDMSYLCKFSMDYIGSLVQLKQLQLDRLAFRLHMFLAFDMSLDRVSQYKDYKGDGFWIFGQIEFWWLWKMKVKVKGCQEEVCLSLWVVQTILGRIIPREEKL